MQKFLPRFPLLLLFAATLAACQPPSHRSLPAGAAGMEMFTPVKMRLHPLSRIISGAAPALEARIEFTDQFGDVGKGAGTVNIKLFAYSAFMPNHKGSDLAQSQSDFSTPDANREHWDPITRTYLFKLPIPPASLENVGRVQLAATLILSNGTALSDNITLPVK